MLAGELRAIVLAAGVGRRLGGLGAGTPKCLLRFGGRTLLERHASALAALGVAEITVVVGYRSAAVEAELASLRVPARLRTLDNSDYEQGSVVSLARAREVLLTGGPLLLLDADVLCAAALYQHLVRGEGNAFFADRVFDDSGQEAVKVCVHGGRVAEFRKQVDPALRWDWVGESVGFFRFDADTARELAQRCAEYLDSGRSSAPYEEVIRDAVLAAPERFAVCDVSGVPWIEIDFAADVERARREVLPQLGAGGAAAEPELARARDARP